MSEEILLPELKPRRRRRLVLMSLTGLFAGLGLFGHQAGFVVWQMDPMDLGFTQVAQAGVLHGTAPDVGVPDMDEGAASELLRPGRAEGEREMVSERAAETDLIENSKLPRGVVQAKRNGLPAPKLADVDERDLREDVVVKDHAVDLCPGGPGCGDLEAEDKHLDDDLEELTVLAALEEIPEIEDDKDDNDKSDREEDCDDDRDDDKDRDRDHDRDHDRDGHRGGGHD